MLLPSDAESGLREKPDAATATPAAARISSNTPSRSPSDGTSLEKELELPNQRGTNDACRKLRRKIPNHPREPAKKKNGKK